MADTLSGASDDIVHTSAQGTDIPREINPAEDAVGLSMYLELIKGLVIRLIELLPGTADDIVRVRLSIHELKHTPDYDAISYVWGQSPERATIFCNGIPLFITTTLDACLRRIRLPDRSRYVWADAVCINQKSTDERNHHVAFMNLVYINARQVLVCMRHGTDEDATNVKNLISEHMERSAGYNKVNDMPILSAEDEALTDQRWASVGKLFRNEWFTRAWVLQEVGVAKEPIVLWGKQEFDYRELMRMSRWIIRCAPNLQSRAKISLLTVHTDWEDWSDSWNVDKDSTYGLSDLLSAAKGLNCGELHDHIYALLGHPLMQDKEQGGPLIRPNYGRSFEDVLKDFTVLAVPQVGIKFLSAVEHNEQTIREELPSWVVRWDMDIIWNSMGYYESFYYRASGPEVETQPPVIEGKHLIEDACYVDTVSNICSFSADGTEFELDAASILENDTELRSTLREIWKIVHDPSSQQRYSQPRSAMALTLTAGLMNYDEAEADFTTYQAHFGRFCKVWEAALNESHAELDKKDYQEADDFYRYISLSCKGRSFFITNQGYFGIGPLITQPGDECHIFKGARVPFVLRPAGDGTYRLVAETYLHGVMRGEYVAAKDIDWKTTVLC